LSGSSVVRKQSGASPLTIEKTAQRPVVKYNGLLIIDIDNESIAVGSTDLPDHLIPQDSIEQQRS
jgi:uncharacterized protein (DUF427 family)